ncbi:hypothetical protein [Aeromonas phage vB_ AhaP_PT2]|uniref:Uncharacterized protein n=1 Tax=Aeromonas phage vB_ AhaP_PT2 TaxID=2924715 RepID=A0AC61TT74_9CAUD|nr:hypothetical protein [Aeromonas phage vB_ AhaP_PT2]
MFDLLQEPLFEMEDYEKVPTISKELTEYLAAEFSADAHIARGLLKDPNVVRSESYLLGFLAGLQYAQQTVRVLLANQDAKFLEE